MRNRQLPLGFTKSKADNVIEAGEIRMERRIHDPGLRALQKLFGVIGRGATGEVGR